MSASSCFWIGSFFSVVPEDWRRPRPSRGRTPRSRSTFFSWAIAMTRWRQLFVGLENHFAGLRDRRCRPPRTRLRARRRRARPASTLAFLSASSLILADLLAGVQRPGCRARNRELGAGAAADQRIVDHLPHHLAALEVQRDRRCRTSRRISLAPRRPRARRNTVARNLRLRSMRTYSRFFGSYSNSTHEPRYGMICAT